MPGHVDEARLRRRSGSVVNANPRSMVSPRSFSSAKRSGSVPVSASTSVDLPWSTCPAVATTHGDDSGARRAAPASERRRRRGRPYAGRTRARPSSTRATTSCSRSAGDERCRGRRWMTAIPTDGMVEPGQRPAARRPPRCRRPRGRATHPRSRSARARRSATGVVAIRHNGISVASPDEVRRTPPTGERQRELVGPHRTARGWRAIVATSLVRAHDDPGLRSAEQLVARERHERRAGGDRLAHARARRAATAAVCSSHGVVSSSRPEPASTITGRTERASASTGVDSTKPTMR